MSDKHTPTPRISDAEMVQQISLLIQENNDYQRQLESAQREIAKLQKQIEELPLVVSQRHHERQVEVDRLSAINKEMREGLKGIADHCNPDNNSHEVIWRIADALLSRSEQTPTTEQ